MSTAEGGPSPAEARRRKQQWINIAIYAGIFVLILASRWYASRQEAAKPVKAHVGKKAGAEDDAPASDDAADPGEAEKPTKSKRKNSGASTRAKTEKRTTNGRFAKPSSDDTNNAADDPPAQATATSTASSTATSLVMKNIVCRDEDGEEIFRGDVDLGPTLARIERGETLRFSHDGVVFENRENRLPRKPGGYYHEWVQPTEGERGPGPQRIITGEGGDAWYTFDHYRSFKRIR
jgi:filamentous hemagglutinin